MSASRSKSPFMTISPGTWLPRLFFGALLLSLLGMGFFSKRGWLDWRRMVRQNEELTREIARSTQEWDLLERQIEKIKSDPGEQERTIRRVLGYVRESEFVIEF
jgi:cell division protein FtsB